VAKSPALSPLVVEEYFSTQDPRFLDAVREHVTGPALAALAERWKKDARPWARAQLFAYLDRPLDARGHHVLVKRAFKHAEETRDDELMAAFLVAFDRSARRVRARVGVWDPVNRVYQRDEVLRVRGEFPGRKDRPRPAYWRRSSRLFSAHTRHYLRRRAWRYFRTMAFARSVEYVGAVARALERYTDADLERGENILDSWGLVHALFRHAPALRFGSTWVEVAEGHRLADLAPAPWALWLWQDARATPVLMHLVAAARSRLVRVFAMRLLREQHAERLGGLAVADLLLLLDHADPEVQRFGAELLSAARDLDKLTVEQWLRLLSTRNLEALALLTAALQKHVLPERFSLDQRLELAVSPASPVAALGLALLSARPPAAGELSRLARLADAECTALAREIATWALGQVTSDDAYQREVASAFLDSLARPAREAAWQWLTGGAARAAFADAELWARLVETPHEELRLALVDRLAARAARPAIGGDLAPVWTACLLAVHRGGRQKAKAVAQVRAALEADPARGEQLVPALAVAIRSVRAGEAAAGLAAVVRAVEARPELVPLVRRVLPELDLGGAP